MYSKTIEQELYSDKWKRAFEAHTRLLNKYEGEKLKRFIESSDRRGELQRKFRDGPELKHYRKVVRGSALAGVGVGGTLGYVIAKKATNDLNSASTRKLLVAGSTLAGAGIGGVTGGVAGHFYTRRAKGVRNRYRRFLKNLSK